MGKYLTTFKDESLYNDFLIGPDCPYVNVSYITDTDEVKYYKASDQDYSVPFTVKILNWNFFGAEGPEGITLTFNIRDDKYETPIKVKVNNGDWQEFYNKNDVESIKLEQGDTAQIIMKSNGICDMFHSVWTEDLRIELSGNIMSTIWGDDYEYCNASLLPFGNDVPNFQNLIGTLSALKYANDLVLPAKNLPKDIFKDMFKGYSNLEKSSNFYADYLPSGSLSWTLLQTPGTDMPVIKAKAISAENTFVGFMENSSVENTPQTANTGLQIEKIHGCATPWGFGAFQSMFKESIYLKHAPAWKNNYEFCPGIETTHLGQTQFPNIFNETFKGCYNLLDTQWKVHARIEENGIAQNANWWSETFNNCEHLVKAFDFVLGAERTEDISFYQTFNNCYQLHELNLAKISGPITFDYVNNMGLGVGVIYVHPNSVYLDSNTEYYNQTPYTGWKVVSSDLQSQYLTFMVLGDTGTTFEFVGNDIEYSTDGGSTWTTLPDSDPSPTIHKGETIMWRGSNMDLNNGSGIGYFYGEDDFLAYGNVMSLIYGNNFASQVSLSGQNGVFKNLFNGCTKLMHADHIVLPATTLAEDCYQTMFYGCTGLYTVPELSATTLAQGCYNQMFRGCTSLITSPELPATTLADSCYEAMFESCTSLTTAPELPATTLADSCYYGMFSSCTSLTTVPELPATTLAYSCYLGMFYGCTSLTTAPELPATTLAQSCYFNMFENCTSLTIAPVLPATTLVTNCYLSMFAGCTSLNYIKCLATDISASNCTNNWVSNVSATGTFIKANSMTSWTTGTSGIPSGWTTKDV